MDVEGPPRHAGPLTSWVGEHPLAGAGDPLVDAQTEQFLLGTLLMFPDSLAQLPDGFRADHYGVPEHADIHLAIEAVSTRAGGGACAVLVMAALNSDSAQRAYVSGLLVGAMPPECVLPFGTNVMDLALRRDLLAALAGMATGVLKPRHDAPLTGVVADGLAEVERVMANVATTRPASTMRQAMDAALDMADRAARTNGLTGISTGFPSVDDVISGLSPADLVVLAGRPGSGKSSLGWQMAVSAARAGVGVLVVSLEMSAAALGRRALATTADVPLAALQKGNHGPYAERLVRARAEMVDLPLVIEDAGGLTAAEISLKVRLHRRHMPLGLVMVDHLHIIRVDEAAMKSGATWAVGKVSNAMKRLAKEYDLPVLLLAQLSRALETRDDKRPTLSDLRQSGEIEQDADAVGFVYRAEMHLRDPAGVTVPNEGADKRAARIAEYDSARVRFAGVAELLFEKVREGERRAVPLRFDATTTRFSEVPQ